MRISDWSSDVCSSDLRLAALGAAVTPVDLPGYDMVAGRRAGFLRVEVEAAHVYAGVMREAPQRISPLHGRYLDFGPRASAQQLLRADPRAEQGAFAPERCFDAVDPLLLPTTPNSGFPLDGHPPQKPAP